jgi:hypothetical protein
MGGLNWGITGKLGKLGKLKEIYMTDPSHRWIVDKKDKLDFFISFVKDQYESGKYILYTIKDTTRSDRQNNAMHLWFRQIAEKLNDAGYWVRHPFSDNFEIPFTEVLVKEMLYKPTAKAMFNKETTTKLTPSELSEAAEVLVRWLSEHKGVYVPFPQQLKDQLK